jgi:uncharacterized membrane protein YjgN (DUF898 family)
MTDAVTLDPPPLPGSPPPPLPGNPPPLPGLVRFVGPEWAYWQLRIKGAALLLVTLGIYRFWLMTDVRRFLWSNTEIAGETLEYDGLATELLLGFLFAIAILIPIYVAIALASLELDLPDYASALGGLALFVVFGEFARYRARRYRLTRTVFRGLRFHQDGSGWLYALYAILWWILIIVSLGLAYPWAQANLQRYMMRHTSYGRLPGRFEGSGWRLFLRGLPLWLASVGPLLVAAGIVAARIDWHAFDSANPEDAKDGAFAVIGADLVGKFGTKTLMAIGIGGIAGSVLAAILLYPVFQAIVYRWWLSGLRFGGIARHVAAAHRPSLPHLPALHRSCLVVHDGSFHWHRRSGLRHLRAVKRRPYSGQPDSRPRRDRGRDRRPVLCRLCARDFGHASGSDHLRTVARGRAICRDFGCADPGYRRGKSGL